MRALPEKSVDVVVTSPPYNLGIGYSKYVDEKTTEEYLDWCAQWASEVKRVLVDQGSFFLNVGAAPSNPSQPYQLLLRLEKLFKLQNTFHWIKAITVRTTDAKQLSVGHFKPINSERFVNDCHEFVFHLTKEGNVPLQRRAEGVGVEYVHKSNINRWGHTNGEDRRCRGNAWFIPYETINSRDKDRPHPATFPRELAMNCARIHGWRPDLVMADPFVGIGSSAVAAVELRVKEFIGFDIDEGYLEVAQERVKEKRSEMESMLL